LMTAGAVSTNEKTSPRGEHGYGTVGHIGN
jgi:hypothetical protein